MPLQPPHAFVNDDQRWHRIATLQNIQELLTAPCRNFRNLRRQKTREMIERPNHQAKQRYQLTESRSRCKSSSNRKASPPLCGSLISPLDQPFCIDHARPIGDSNARAARSAAQSLTMLFAS
jgi:hypothetical protein